MQEHADNMLRNNFLSDKDNVIYVMEIPFKKSLRSLNIQTVLQQKSEEMK